jgi:hypothetical protein
VDDSNPWLGLASFTEETQGFFFGREEEVAELSRRVQRKLLTVLFGQSGLGKTSILRAGMVPRLRGHGYCPIYVRIAYGADAPEPSEQIKQAIVHTVRRAGEWTQPGVAVAGESLWEYLHHRDDVLRDESGKDLVPLLIFDQFEEIFTLAQGDEAGRARAARFIEDLADLVENRPPRALEAKIEADESFSEQFDFARANYRVLLALREDYLAPLESLKATMPSITQNRLRLAPMTGAQALAAVLKPGKHLVSEEVAGAIVRFVAGGAEIANAEVEPSLLSLICRELNDTRIAQGRSEISIDLVDGSHAAILTNFYERALADQPAGVRRIIEDDLLTASGYRENIAEERIIANFEAAGAVPETLAILVNRRLLRIEERLDVRRVELTHDVLCDVVKASRDRRKEREAREATERLLTEQRERELAARRALIRARKIATGCIVLAIGAVAAAGIAVLSTQRAHNAERIAEDTRRQAEQLLGYLTQDLAPELNGYGRLDVVKDLAKREIDYFHALPPALKGTESQRNGALALIEFAKASRRLGDPDGAKAACEEALGLLEKLHGAGDSSEATLIALARAEETESAVLDTRHDRTAVQHGERAVALIAPLAAAPRASSAIRRADIEARQSLGLLLAQNLTDDPRAIELLSKVLPESAALGGRDASDIPMAVIFTETSAFLVQALGNNGQDEAAARVGADGVAAAEKLLEVRPGNLIALHSEQVIDADLMYSATDELRPLDAILVGTKALALTTTLRKLDPNNKVTVHNLAIGQWGLGDAHWDAGHTRESLEYLQAAREAIGQSLAFNRTDTRIQGLIVWELAAEQAELGDPAVETTLLEERSQAKAAQAAYADDPFLVLTRQMLTLVIEAEVAGIRGDYAAEQRLSGQVLALESSARPRGTDETKANWRGLSAAHRLSGESAYFTGQRLPAANASNGGWRQGAEVSTFLALALSGQHREAEARSVLGPVLKKHRELAAAARGDPQEVVELARTLYAAAISDPEHRAALLREAGGLLDHLPADVRQLRSVQLWRRLIDQPHRLSAQSENPIRH